MNTARALSTQSASPCRRCSSAGLPCDEKRRTSEQCSRCAILGYTCRSPVDVDSYTQPFLSFISENPTTFHAVANVCKRLESNGFTNLSERDSWTGKLSRGGKYCFTRNGSSVIAFVVGENYKSGNGASVIASHIDALTTRVKPIPTLTTKAGYLQLGVAPYAGALNNTWWDRDLGIGGRVLVKNSETGKIETKLVKLGWPIARIPTLAPHFGAAADLSHPNKETEMVPIIGLDSADTEDDSEDNYKRRNPSVLGSAGTFAATQPERLVKAIAGEINIQDCECCAILAKSMTNVYQIAVSSTGSWSFSILNRPSSADWTKNSSSRAVLMTSSALSPLLRHLLPRAMRKMRKMTPAPSR